MLLLLWLLRHLLLLLLRHLLCHLVDSLLQLLLLLRRHLLVLGHRWHLLLLVVMVLHDVLLRLYLAKIFWVRQISDRHPLIGPESVNDHDQGCVKWPLFIWNWVPFEEERHRATLTFITVNLNLVNVLS